MKFIPKIRPANTGDINGIFELISHYASEDVILVRNQDEISESIDLFLVAEHNSKILGCVSFCDYGPSLKEIRSLCVEQNHKKRGIGKLLVTAMIENLISAGAPKIFVLTYSPEFFKRCGFSEVQKETLPEKIWKDCNNCRHRDHCGESAMVYKHH